ncbi:hypothetical protein V8F20_004325 [Naviculisporaceae sp. PSN 640]
MTGHRVFIETNSSGSPVFVRRRRLSTSSGSGSYTTSSNSSSRHYRPRTPTMNDERIIMLRNEVERLLERERELSYSYNQALRHNELQKAEAQRIQRSLSDQVHRLQHEKSELRKDLDTQSSQARRYESKYREAKSKNEELERENGVLTIRIRDLTRQMHLDVDRRVGELRSQIEDWRRRYASSEKTLSRMRDNLDQRIEEVRVLTKNNQVLTRENESLNKDNQNLVRENDILKRSLDTAKRMLNRHGLYIT